MRFVVIFEGLFLRGSKMEHISLPLLDLENEV